MVRSLLRRGATSVLVVMLWCALCAVPAGAGQDSDTPVGDPPIQAGWSLEMTGDGHLPTTAMIEAVRRVTPAVVAINGIRTTKDGKDTETEVLSSGSGFIVDEAGYIVTNRHVIAGTRDVTVSLSDGRTFKADRIVADPVNDLAVITIAASDLPTATIADSSSLEVGMMVAVIGNALDRGISMNGGWISRLGVSAKPSETATLYNLIQTDAPINPGNSGGPMVNMKGEVVGITNAKLVGTTVEAVGYAIPTDQAVPVIQELVRRGSVRRSWIGVVLATVNQGVADLYQLSANRGVLVTKVTAGSPAAAAGIAPGDVIVRFGGTPYSTSSELDTAIRASQAGTPVQVDLWRSDQRETVTVTPRIDPRT